MSVAWVAVGVAAVGTAVQADSARKAGNATNRAVAAQETAAQAQQRLAQEQWDFQRDVYLPKAMQQADDQLALSKQIVGKQLADSDYYRGLADEQFGQAKKSWKYQDQMMQLADDYSSGKMADTEAGRAAADVEQAFGDGIGAMSRGAARFGINTGSDGFSASLGDLYTKKILARAGAQTNARANMRTKAENMVALAAGAGQAGFGTGLGAAGLASGATAGATATNNSSGAALNGVNANYSAGLSGASAGFGNVANTWNSAARNASNNPWADFTGGLMNTGVRLWAANQNNAASNTNTATGTGIDPKGYGTGADADMFWGD